jgi:hypothetical protein
MDLPHGGREYAKFYPTPSAGLSLQVSFDAGVTQSPLVAGTEDVNKNWTPNVAGTVYAILVAHPAATGNPVGTVVLPVGYHEAPVTATSSPEIIIRTPGGVNILP